MHNENQNDDSLQKYECVDLKICGIVYRRGSEYVP